MRQIFTPRRLPLIGLVALGVFADENPNWDPKTNYRPENTQDREDVGVSNATLELVFDRHSANFKLQGWLWLSHFVPDGDDDDDDDETLPLAGRVIVGFLGTIDEARSDVLNGDGGDDEVTWTKSVGFGNNSANIDYDQTGAAAGESGLSGWVGFVGDGCSCRVSCCKIAHSQTSSQSPLPPPSCVSNSTLTSLPGEGHAVGVFLGGEGSASCAVGTVFGIVVTVALYDGGFDEEASAGWMVNGRIVRDYAASKLKPYDNVYNAG
ncbi:uncharacterized protein BDV17DRAFT_294926 [Aspergillus undulatus]|uniref:uncharacterized protein n=1 Tax=Aspergillus undulatus TaxID=1810928 RepID=UPI003CCE4FCC